MRFFIKDMTLGRKEDLSNYIFYMYFERASFILLVKRATLNPEFEPYIKNYCCIVVHQ